MKKITLVLALAAVAQFAFAQSSKQIKEAREAVEAAKTVLDNPKKAENAANWIKYGQALVAAYEAPAGNFMVGMDESQRLIVQGKYSPKSESTVTMGGDKFTKQEFSSVNLYLNKRGQISVIEKTKEAVPGALSKALEAYSKAASLDPKGKKSKDICAALQKITESFEGDATTAYYMKDYKKASDLFYKAYQAKNTAPLSQVDSSSLYNSGLTAWMGTDYAKAKERFLECRKIGYYAKDGDLYTKLADIESKTGNQKESKEILEEGFAKYPQSQGILVGLINYYVTTGDSPEKLFELIDKAKKNEPKNASLVYVEGQIHEKLGNTEKALASYDQCTKVNPEYAYGYIGQGILYWKQSNEIGEKAQKEMDDAKYNVLIKELQAVLEKSLPPFMKAYEVSKDEALKGDVAKFIKDISFRLRNSDAKYQEIYDKFNAIVKEQK